MGKDTIAFVPVRYGNEVVGGAETLVRNIAEQLHNRGRPVEILTTCALDPFTWADYYPPGEGQVRGIRVLRFPAGGNRYAKRGVFKLEQKILKERNVSVRQQERWVRNVVFSEGLYDYLRQNRDAYRAFIFAPYLFGTTYVGSSIVSDRAFIIPCLHDEPFAKLEIMRRMMHSVRGILFNSEPEMELARRLFGQDIPGRVVGMGFDDFVSSADRFRAKYGIRGDFILYCGRREIAKNVPLLLRYFCNYIAHTGRDLKLVLTGAGNIPIPRVFQEHILDLGYVSDRDKLDAYAAASLICHPSVNESFSIIILEAWLAGTPCLVHADCAVTRYHARNSRGGLWFKDYPQFHECLTLLLNDRKLARELGRNGREYVLANYAWDRVIDQFDQAVEGSGL